MFTETELGFWDWIRELWPEIWEEHLAWHYAYDPTQRRNLLSWAKEARPAIWDGYLRWESVHQSP